MHIATLQHVRVKMSKNDRCYILLFQMFPTMFKQRNMQFIQDYAAFLRFTCHQNFQRNIRRESGEGSQQMWLDLHQWSKSNVNIALIRYLVREHFCQSAVRKNLAAFTGSLRVLRAVRTPNVFSPQAQVDSLQTSRGTTWGPDSGTWLNYPHNHPNTDITSLY